MSIVLLGEGEFVGNKTSGGFGLTDDQGLCGGEQAATATLRLLLVDLLYLDTVTFTEITFLFKLRTREQELLKENDQ
jgi:hypothetical protein